VHASGTPADKMHLLKHPVFTRFSLLCLLARLALAVGMGYAISALVTRLVSEWEWDNTAELVRREADDEIVHRIFADTTDRERASAGAARSRRES